MNILYLIENLDVGGAQVRLFNDLKFMDRKRFNNIVCSLTGNGRLLPEVASLGIKVYSLDGMCSLSSVLKLANIIRKNRIDIIHTQLFFSDLYGRLLGKLLRVPFIVTTVQSSVYEPNNEYLYSLKRKLLDRYSGRFCNKRFIAVSEFVKDSISRHFSIDPEMVEVIPNYVDFYELNQVEEEDLNVLKKELSIDSKEIVLITVGRLNPAKGVQYLLKALSEIVTRHRSIKLLIVGDGFYREYLEKLTQDCRLVSNVVFLGERDDVKELLHISDIFVFPTLSEGLPVSLLEAMAIGKPCLASNIGPVREIITDGETGLLFKSRDSEDIERALITLISDSIKAEKLGQRGKDSVRTKFGSLKNIKLLEELYISLYMGL